jgi:UDP-glucose 4-epimerase
VRSHTYHHNVLGSAHLINAAAQSGTVRCFVFTSSVAVYGDQPGPWSEDTAPNPLDPYGISKHAIELDLRSAFAMFGLPYIIFRPHNVYGEGQNLADPHRNVIGIFMRHILEGKELPIFGDGSQTRAFTYIADIAPSIAASVDHPNLCNGVFNIGSDRSCAVLDLARKVGEAMGVQPRLKFLPARPEAAQTYPVHARLRKHFGSFPPTVELEIGLRKMAAWARRIGVRHAPCSPPVEAGAHLPEYWRAAEAPALDPAEEMNGVLRSLKQNAVARSVRVS